LDQEPTHKLRPLRLDQEPTNKARYFFDWSRRNRAAWKVEDKDNICRKEQRHEAEACDLPITEDSKHSEHKKTFPMACCALIRKQRFDSVLAMIAAEAVLVQNLKRLGSMLVVMN